MNYCEKIRQSMIDGDDDSVVKYIKKSLLSGYNPKYILKNISNAKQCGAICKLYRNVKNHEGIIKRQEDLIQKLGSQVVEYDDASWIIVNSIKKEDLNNEEKFKDVLHKFLEDFIKYAFTVEFISKGY